MHPLFQKKSMDAVNEALLKPTEYPAADKEYNHPTWFKGTEPESIKTGKQASISYEEACHNAVNSLRLLAEMSSDPDIIGLCRMDAEDLQFFINQEKKKPSSTGTGTPEWIEKAPAATHAASFKGRRRVAEIEIHTSPENGGNPNLIGRSLLDEDAKDEIKEGKGGEDDGYKRIGSRRRFSSPLFQTSQHISRSSK